MPEVTAATEERHGRRMLQVSESVCAAGGVEGRAVSAEPKIWTIVALLSVAKTAVGMQTVHQGKH